MSRIKIVLVFLFAAFGCSRADYFLDMRSGMDVSENVRELPTFFYGGGFALDYYFSSFDGGAQASFEYRFHKRHSVDAFATAAIAGEFYEVGLDYRFFFFGNLMGDGHDDFLRFGVSGTYMEKKDDSYFPPTISFGYGRDFLFFDKADFIGRVEVRASYIAGEPLSQRVKDLPLFEETHLVTRLEFSLLFF